MSACAILCNEPFYRTVDEVKKMTPVQVKKLFLCERDPDGHVLVKDIPVPTVPRNISHGLYTGLPRRMW